MAFAPINPTQITPPRVDFIDERTGAISREWYRFLLSLKDSAQTSQDAATLEPDSTSLTVSYSAMLDTLAQATGSQSTGASVDAVAAVQTQVQDLASQPTSASVDAVAAVQTQVQDLALSLQADIQSYLAPIWSAVQDLALTPSVIPSVGSMVYPAAGIANSTGTAWGTSYSTTGSGTSVVLASSPTITGTITFGGTDISAPAWTVNGVGIVQAATTYTDTTSTGAVSDVGLNVYQAGTLAASNSITVTRLYGSFFKLPVAGTNVTATNRYALTAQGVYIAGPFDLTHSGGAGNVQLNVGQTSGSVTIGGTTGITTGIITLGQATVSQTTNIQAGATASGSTKTINIGTGGLSGSTTAITIGSTAAAGIVTINGSIKPLSVTASPAAGTLTPAADTANQFNYTALTGIYIIAAPSGTPADGQVLILRFKDSGVVATFTWNAIYRIVGTTLPTTTVASKTTYVGCKYNSTDTKWDVIAVAQEA